MAILSEHDVFLFVAELGIIVLAARFFGEIARRLGQPIIVGEVIAGVVLGPMVFGNLLPEYRDILFPAHGLHPYLLQGISWLCVIFLLLITGLEIDFRSSIKQGRSSLVISFLGISVPLLGIFALTQFMPAKYIPDGVQPLHVQLLISVALSVVAIPVISKILFDLKILRSEVGVKILTSGVLSDVWGWLLLAIVVALIAQGSVTVGTILKPLITMILYLGVTLFIGRKKIDMLLDALGLKHMDTTTTISLLFALALLNGAIAHLLGIHVIFGAFVAGIMAGESTKITPYMRQGTQDFIFGFFAPIFFVLIGMQLKFSSIEIWIPILILLFVSSIFKIGGAYIGGIIGGLGRKNALAVACGLNTQGTMGIVVALIAYEMHIFNEEIFGVIVVICVLTSLLTGPLLKWAMVGVCRPLAKYFDSAHVFLELAGKTKEEVIKNMADQMAERKLIKNTKAIQKAIWEREVTLSTAIGEGVALPHARIVNLKKPILCFFRLKHPVDFASPDNKFVQLLFLELTNRNDEGLQLNLIAQVARFISSEKNREKLLHCSKEEDIHNILSFDEKA